MTIHPKTIEVSDATFERRVLSVDTPVLLDFGADWCPPCKVMIPLLEELAVEYQNKALIARLDVDNSPVTAAQFKVRNLPTMLIFKNGHVVERIVGTVPKKVLADKLNAHI